MEQVAKMFLGIILMIFLAFTSIGTISASIDASHAEDYAAKVAALIEAGDFNANVIQTCKDKAVEETGYKRLEVNVMDVNQDGRPDMAEIILYYDYTIPILNITGREHAAKAYAR